MYKFQIQHLSLSRKVFYFGDPRFLKRLAAHYSKSARLQIFILDSGISYYKVFLMKNQFYKLKKQKIGLLYQRGENMRTTQKYFFLCIFYSIKFIVI